MPRLKPIIGACLLTTALLSTVVSHAATYYVATSGSNSNPGTSSLPWRTVAYAASKMVAGDTTYVRGGTYNEGVIRFGKPGTQSAPIKLLNYSGEFPIINFIDKNQYHRVLIQNNAGSNREIGWITIEGFELRNGFEGIKYHNLHDSTIRRNWIHHNYNQGILGVGGTRVLIDRNKINHNGNWTLCATTPSQCSLLHGVYVGGSYTTITNNIFYDNLAYGVVQNGSTTYSSSLHAGPEFAGAANWVISNNTFAYQNYRGGIVLWGSQCQNARIENNIFYENSVKLGAWSAQGIDIGASPTGVQIRNNLAFASGSGGTAFIVSATSNYTQSGNTVNTLNPKFANAPTTLPSSPNFALTSGSPAIDKGLSLSSTKISYPGTTRPKLSAYDIGAFEYYSSTQLASPTSLQVGN